MLCMRSTCWVASGRERVRFAVIEWLLDLDIG